MAKSRNKGKNNPMYGIESPFKGKKHTEKTKKRLSELASLRIECKNPNWKGGKKIKSRSSKFKVYEKWRKYILNKYNGKCCLCGLTDNVVVHHPLPVSLFPEYVTEECNGMVLCKKCDREEDTFGGKIRKLKREDFVSIKDEEYIKSL